MSHFNDAKIRQAGATRPGRTPYQDTDYSPYTSAVTIDGGGAGTLTLPTPQRGFVRKWAYLVCGWFPTNIGALAELKLQWRHPTGNELLLNFVRTVAANTPVPLIGGRYQSLVANGTQAIIGIDPVFVQLGRDNDQDSILTILVNGQTISTNIGVMGRYVDLPL